MISEPLLYNKVSISGGGEGGGGEVSNKDCKNFLCTEPSYQQTAVMIIHRTPVKQD